MSRQVSNNWSVEPIGDFISVLTDYTANGSFAALKENVTYYSSPNYAALVRTTDLEKSNFAPERFTDRKGFDFLRKSELFPGDIVIANVGSAGKAYRVPAYFLPMTLAPNMYLVKFSDKMHKDFAFQVITSDQFQESLLESCANTTLKAINKSSFRNIEVAVPPLPEQQKIAAILSSVDDVIEKTRAQIDKLKNLKTGMMQELLTKGIGHTEFKDSPVGRIPLDWKVLPLELIVEEVVDCEHKTAPYVESSEFLVVRTSNVRDGELVYDDMRFTTSEAFSEWTKRAVPSYGDVLLTREAPAGEACMVPAGVKLCMGQRMVLLRPKTDTVYPDYFSLYITSELAKLAIYKLSVGTTVTRINIEDIKDIPCLVPSLKEQREIQLKISSIQSMINKSTFLLKSNEKIKKALMQDLLTGTVRVNVD
ncbi:restriction endonuclease subunit S [Paenalcaligenes hominis]|uniref:restriction endonuclease subunit S n=1 Tax=Paenalcaligenes hominis TaxID=643674 RepID=UPI00352558A0